MFSTNINNKRRAGLRKGQRNQAQRGAKKNSTKSIGGHYSRGWNPISGIVTDKYRTTMRYFINTNFTSASNALTLQYAGNSVFDPEIALGGYQPPGFDNMSALYKNFLVVRSRIKVQVINLSNGPGSVTLYPSNNTTSVTPT